MVRLQGDFAKPPEKRFNYKNCFDALFRVRLSNSQSTSLPRNDVTMRGCIDGQAFGLFGVLPRIFKLFIIIPIDFSTAWQMLTFFCDDYY